MCVSFCCFSFVSILFDWVTEERKVGEEGEKMEHEMTGMSGVWKLVNPLEFYLFLYKYDQKCDQIFRPETKGNLNKQMRHFFIYFLWKIFQSYIFVCGYE